jgi:presenilin 1
LPHPVCTSFNAALTNLAVFASYLGIVAGLGITLLCLAIYQRALPALPFSIALGVLFYFLTRLVLEPYLVPLSSSLTYY